jgi:hypothetical protein
VALFAIGIATGRDDPPESRTLHRATFAPILGSLIGLGVGIDYALFIVTRSRQNLKQGMSVEDSIITAIDTSGRAVLFAGATVCVALLGMLILGFSFLVGLGVAAALTVFITMMASLTLLPVAARVPEDARVLSRQRAAQACAVPDPRQRSSRAAGSVGPTLSARSPRTLSAISLSWPSQYLTIPLLSLHLGPFRPEFRPLRIHNPSGLRPDCPGIRTRDSMDHCCVVGSIHNDHADRAAMQKLDIVHPG